MIKITGNETEVKVLKSLFANGQVDRVTQVLKMYAGSDERSVSICIAGIDIEFEEETNIIISEANVRNERDVDEFIKNAEYYAEHNRKCKGVNINIPPTMPN